MQLLEQDELTILTKQYVYMLSFYFFLPWSPEQRKLWLRDAKTFRIIGGYAQTELGHGSSVKNIETTATFDQVLTIK